MTLADGQAREPHHGRVLCNALAACLIAVAVVGCGSASSTPSPAPASVAPSQAPSAAPSDSQAPGDSSVPVVPDSPVAGVVIAIDAPTPNDVKGFTLRTNDGEQIAFTWGPLDNAADFPVSDLSDDLSTAAPILVFFRPMDGKLVVYQIEDAG